MYRAPQRIGTGGFPDISGDMTKDSVESGPDQGWRFSDQHAQANAAMRR